MPLSQEIFEKAIRIAAAEGRRWMGATSPNPPVGAVALDGKGQILAVAAHHHAGGLHAEALLLNQCAKNGLLPQIDTLCVTLEPCNHQGRTPPCTEAIIRSGIRNIVIGARDPNHHVQGGGIERLQASGLNVVSGIAEDECRQLMHAFSYVQQTGKPWVTVKRALNLEGSMIPPKGQKTFTSQESLRLAHRLRKKADALVTGSGTILADDPLFTVRHVPDHHKRRYLAVLDRRRRVPADYIRAAGKRGYDVLIYDDVSVAMNDLSAKGAEDILVEAGPSLSQSVLDLGLWAMSVTVRQAETDLVEVVFNPSVVLPFDARHFCWDHFLPEER